MAHASLHLCGLGICLLAALGASRGALPGEPFPFPAQSVRPYSLSINREDYHYAPKPRHLRPSRLIRLLGAAFEPFWMSVERPAGAGVWLTEEAAARSAARRDAGRPTKLTVQKVPGGEASAALLANFTTITRGFNISASPELVEGAARYRRKLEKEAEDLDLSSLPGDVAGAVREWLVRSATCGLRYRWMDLGPVFWPRWLRHTDCYRAGGEETCSFPSGMACRRAQVTHLKILAWHCWGSEENGVRRGADKVTPTVRMGALSKNCVWRQVPYPVVTACKCSCK
ncbi:noggin-like [Denticeps clupeoides]|uniref:Noggin n=1 Tax=Denticeps clupeoides TaxID=299321 RepID=A0AAY3ZYM0_9TELE|nr:noggin-like [Denticeps clupeoides]